MILYVLLLIVHVFVSIALVVTVLLQSSKGGGLAGTFGGSGITGGIFGGRGAAPFLAKATTVFAVLFMLTSISFNFVSPGGVSKSSIERALEERGAAGSSSAVTNEMPGLPEAPDVDSETASEQSNPKDNASQQSGDE